MFNYLKLPVALGFLIVVQSVAAAPPPEKGKPGTGDGDGTSELQQCSYPSFSDSPKDKLRGEAANFYVQYGTAVDQFTETDLVFNETGETEDNGTKPIKPAIGGDSSGRWFVENMHDVQHRTGNEGITVVTSSNAGMDEMGEQCDLPCSPKGKRWSAWYDYLPAGSLVNWSSPGPGSNSYLSLGGRRVQPSFDYTRPGTEKWFNNKLYTTWLSTFQREFNTETGGVFGTAKAGSQVFNPPMYLKTKVNFSQMKTPGFRLSMWMMPVERVDDYNPISSIAYDGDPTNGFEMDIFEFEPVSVILDANMNVEKVCGNAIEFSWINAFYNGKGKAPAGIDGKNNFEGDEEGYCSALDCSETYANPIPVNGSLLRPDINESTHLIEFLWTDQAIVWAFNGEIVLEITDTTKMPDVDRDHYLIVSREMTNGLSGGASVYDGNGYFLPPETGLYGWNGNSNVGDHFDFIDDDKALIDFIEIYQKDVIN